MDINSASDFQEKVDEIIKDTENFVNATKQLNAVRNNLSEYMNESVDMVKKLNEMAGAVSRQVELAEKFFNGDFTTEFTALLNEVNAIAEISRKNCEAVNEQLEGIVSEDIKRIREYSDKTYRVIEDESEKLSGYIEELTAYRKKKYDDLLNDKIVSDMNTYCNRIVEAADTMETRFDMVNNRITDIEDKLDRHNEMLNHIQELLERKSRIVPGFNRNKQKREK